MTATLPRTLPSPDGKPLPPPGSAEVFRVFARDLAAGRRPWTAETAHFIADRFDRLAADWDTTQATGRDDPLLDALTRGGPFPAGPCLQVGSGTGSFTQLLTSAFTSVTGLDLSEQMPHRAAGRSPNRVRADAGHCRSPTHQQRPSSPSTCCSFPQKPPASLHPTASCRGSTNSVRTVPSTWPPTMREGHCPDSGRPSKANVITATATMFSRPARHRSPL
ncbi:methyltransferase domain-containing protein [Streptomyces sp. NBC_01390]|uniref:class I SAM-dependent methyltransferase n=1 Tax=Streptomyces sp. NBC_01390 TaxID=2903850 RepID=UPI0032522911